MDGDNTTRYRGKRS